MRTFVFFLRLTFYLVYLLRQLPHLSQRQLVQWQRQCIWRVFISRLESHFVESSYRLGSESRNYLQYQLKWWRTRPYSHPEQWRHTHILHALRPLRENYCNSCEGLSHLFSSNLMHRVLHSSVKTSRWGGVVTAFITMSNIKDEIDWEFPGANTTNGQTNFFWQGNIR